MTASAYCQVRMRPWTVTRTLMKSGTLERPWQSPYARLKGSCPLQLVGRLTSFVCTCSIVEIYNEVVSDLLDPTRTNLLVHDSGRGVIIDNLSRVQVQSGDLLCN